MNRLNNQDQKVLSSTQDNMTQYGRKMFFIQYAIMQHY